MTPAERHYLACLHNAVGVLCLTPADAGLRASWWRRCLEAWEVVEREAHAGPALQPLNAEQWPDVLARIRETQDAALATAARKPVQPPAAPAAPGVAGTTPEAGHGAAGGGDNAAQLCIAEPWHALLSRLQADLDAARAEIDRLPIPAAPPYAIV